MMFIGIYFGIAGLVVVFRFPYLTNVVRDFMRFDFYIFIFLAFFYDILNRLIHFV